MVGHRPLLVPAAEHRRSPADRQIGASAAFYASVMDGRFYRRRWDDSRGDEFDGWGPSVWYFEVGNDGWPVRQVEVYDSGPVLRYGPGHEQDRYGGLGEASLDDPDEDWSPFAITQEAFERAWNPTSG
jgi:hypothetical protein